MKPEGDSHFLIIPFPLLCNRHEEKKVLYFPQNILPGMSGIDKTNTEGNNGCSHGSAVFLLQASFSKINPSGLTVLGSHALK